MWSAYEIPNSHPNIPERQCFNNSAYLDGKDLFRLLCLEPEHQHGAVGYSKPKTFSQCAYEMKGKQRSNFLICIKYLVK